MNDIDDRSVYCPRCRKSGGQDRGLCRFCGEAMVSRGFCPVCEGFVSAPPGSLCPKHEIELLDPPPPDGLRLSPSRMVTIATYALPGEAEGPRLRLEAEGIAVFLDNLRMGNNVIYQVATGGVKLQVPEEHVADARILLSQTWAAKEKDDDLDDPWEGLGPEPAEVRRSVMKLAILIFLFGPAAVWLLGIVLAALR